MLNLTDLLRVPWVDTSLRFDPSADGQRIAFSWNKTGNWEIHELHLSPRRRDPLKGTGKREVKRISRGEGSKFSPRYSPDGKHLAYALDLDGSESFHIVLHDLGTDSHIDLTPHSAYAHQPNFAFSPDGKTLAILSDERGQFALYLISIETGERRLLLDLHHPIWDVKWSSEGKWIAVEVEMEASDRGIFVIEVESFDGAIGATQGKRGKWKQIKTNGRGLNAKHPAWSPDSKFLAFSAESGDWFDIAIFGIETGEIEWLTQSAGDDTSPCWSRDGKRIGWVHAEGAAARLGIRERGGDIGWYQAGEGVHHHPKFLSNDEIIFIFESPKQPPDLWKLNQDGTFEQLTHSLPGGLKEADFVVPEEIQYEGDNGAGVPALLYRAKGNARRAVVNIHGGPNWHFQFLWHPVMSHMASRGWTVLAPSYRGSTGYGRSWQNASRFDLGGVDTRDCAAGAQFLVCERLAHPDRIAVTGRSHGGYLTMTCLTQFPELWCGGSAVVPFLNWFKSHEESREDLQHWNIENMGGPKEDYQRWYNASPYFFLDRVSAPVQLICGGNDPRCPASDSIEAHDKLVSLGKDVEFLLYEDEGHSFLKIDNVIDSEMKRVEFLAKVLKEQFVG